MNTELPLRLSDGLITYFEFDAPAKTRKSDARATDTLRRSVSDGLEEVSLKDKATTVAAAMGDVAEASFTRTAGVIGSLGRDLHAAMVATGADESEVELALKLKGGGDVKVVAASAEYDIKIRLKWRLPAPAESRG